MKPVSWKSAYEATSVLNGSHIHYQLGLRKKNIAYLNGCHLNILSIKIQPQAAYSTSYPNYYEFPGLKTSKVLLIKGF